MLIIFDLDGTLIDSSQDLTISTNATRAQYGLPPLDQLTINSYVGNGAAVLLQKALGPKFSEEALAWFLRFYREHALEHTRLYDGVFEMVSQLAREHTLGVLTNKPQKISIDILSAVGLGESFLRVIGGDTPLGKKPDPAGLLAIVEAAGAAKSETLMVGDSSVDIATARNAAVRCCGVLWGFQPETFAGAPPDYTVAKADDLRELVAGARCLNKQHDRD